ncbi:MAG: hypothetical protein L0H79_00370 [Intrasporangium sp.]|uniref:hypothetical protein n=1 Tax=Intrasporangium sp. TaxID=1925024 RepID=UPI002647F14B|nr:hypothetical protein [Intrasporangium sp.]MDN5794187.1 hypothetical protein [Intrasporangium sp.]
MTAADGAARLALAAALSAAGMRLCPWLPEHTRRPWARTNHAGDPVTLLEGPVWLLGAVGGLVLPGTGGRTTAAALVVTAAGLGMLDDLAGSATSKGLRGHLTALGRGELTTGAVKLIGLAASGIAATAAVDLPRPGARAGAGPGRLAGVLVGGGVIAGTANLVNLLDLRPGRALKSVIVLGMPLSPGGAPAAAALGATLGVIADDLAGRSMLGDTGANAAGALLGLALVERSGLLARSLALAVLTGLTLASERVSFSAVIDRQPLLRRLDQWGRPPERPSSP